MHPVDGCLFIAEADARRVVRVDETSGSVTVVLGSVYQKFVGDGVGPAGTFTYPLALSFTPDGRTLYVADEGAGALRVAHCKEGSDGSRPVHWTLSTLSYTAAALSSQERKGVRCVAVDAAAPHVVYVSAIQGVFRVDTRAQTCTRMEQATPSLGDVYRIAVDAVGRTLLLADYTHGRLWALSLEDFHSKPPALQLIPMPRSPPSTYQLSELVVVDRQSTGRGNGVGVGCEVFVST